MSLILEALKKLERDKPTDARGKDVVLLAPVHWPSRPGRAPWIAASLVLLAIAAVTGVVLLARRPQHAHAPEQPAALVRPAAPPASPEPVGQPVPAGARPPLTAPARAALPVRAASTPRPTPVPFVLTAIAEQDGHPVAVINDRIVRVGDALQGARVLRIGEGEVELEADGRRFTLGF